MDEKKINLITRNRDRNKLIGKLIKDNKVIHLKLIKMVSNLHYLKYIE